MSQSVSVVIPTWNGKPLLERFLPSVLAAADRHQRECHVDVEVVVVDDGSTDGTAEWIGPQTARAGAALRLVRQARNQGFGAAANRGVHAAAFPLVWLLNNDIEVDVDAMAQLADEFTGADTRLFAVHSRMIDLTTGQDVGTGKMGSFARGFLRVHRSYIPVAGAHGPFWSVFATGGSTMYRRELFLRLGGFDELFAPFYLEDVELSYRAWKRGFTVGYAPRCGVRHQFSSTIGPLGNARIERVSQRNRLLFHWIHLHDRGFLAAHAAWVVILAVTAPLTFKFGFLGGLVDALRRLPAVRARRRTERLQSVRSDGDVLEVFSDLAAKGTIRPYDDPRELAG